MTEYEEEVNNKKNCQEIILIRQIKYHDAIFQKSHHVSNIFMSSEDPTF